MLYLSLGAQVVTGVVVRGGGGLCVCWVPFLPFPLIQGPVVHAMATSLLL